MTYLMRRLRVPRPSSDGSKPISAFELYQFRYKNAIGKWHVARYVATKEEIAARYKDYELLGEPQIVEARSRDHSDHGPHNDQMYEERGDSKHE